MRRAFIQRLLPVALLCLPALGAAQAAGSYRLTSIDGQSASSNGVSGTIILNADGSYTATVTEEGETSRSRGVYGFNGSLVTFNSQSGQFLFGSRVLEAKLSGARLTIIVETEDDPEDITLVFQRSQAAVTPDPRKPSSPASSGSVTGRYRLISVNGESPAEYGVQSMTVELRADQSVLVQAMSADGETWGGNGRYVNRPTELEIQLNKSWLETFGFSVTTIKFEGTNLVFNGVDENGEKIKAIFRK